MRPRGRQLAGSRRTGHGLSPAGLGAGINEIPRLPRKMGVDWEAEEEGEEGAEEEAAARTRLREQ
jgi:hypothetical protein